MFKRLLAVLTPLSLFVLIFGLKLDLVHRYGSDLPRWDQFDAEGLTVFVPRAEGRLHPADLIAPHNEHRIVWTKLLGLAELKVNGQWDARLQCVVNAAVHSLIAVLVYLFAGQGLTPRRRATAGGLIALLFALPLAWENPIAGFHSQQYFLLGFSFLAIWLLPAAGAWSARWWIGVAGMFAALGTMGSGLFAAGTVLGLVVVRGWSARDVQAEFRNHWPTVVAAALAVTLGAAGRVTVGYHEELKAGSLADFLQFAIHCLQWPAQSWSWLALVIWWPVGLLAWRLWRRTTAAAGAFPQVLFGLAVWVLLQILATAYTRGAGGGMPSSRYADTLAFGVLVNGLTLLWLWPQLQPATWRLGLGAGWLLAVLGPTSQLAATIFRADLPDNRRHLEACEENVRRYLATDDSSHLVEPNVPYPGIRAFRERIDIPAIRQIMPASVRKPMPLELSGDGGPFRLQNNVRPARTYAAPPVPFPAALQALPDLPSRKVWFSDPARGPGSWSSVPLVLRRAAVLRIIVAGHGEAQLVLREAASADPVATIPTAQLHATHWRILHVPVPAGSLRLTAEVGGAGSWLAFSEPAEMALGSYICWRLVRLGHLLWPLGLALTLVSGVATWYCARPAKALV